jgi:hypothetical protein
MITVLRQISLTLLHAIEVVLSVLLTTFRFSLADEEVTWKTGTFASPTLKNGKICMPLKVSVFESG